jgi:hypothetical protein
MSIILRGLTVERPLLKVYIGRTRPPRWVHDLTLDSPEPRVRRIGRKMVRMVFVASNFGTYSLVPFDSSSLLLLTQLMWSQSQATALE